jgi:L-rhamnose mutarotase
LLSKSELEENVKVARVAFRLRVRPDRILEYEEAHRNVWPTLLQLLKDVGITRYSIFRRGTDLFFYMEVENFEQAWDRIDASPINQHWQDKMRPLFEPTEALENGERFPMMREVFYLE